MREHEIEVVNAEGRKLVINRRKLAEYEGYGYTLVKPVELVTKAKPGRPKKC